MKQLLPCFVAAAGWLMVGCSTPEPSPVQVTPKLDTTTVTASADDLQLTIHLPQTTFAPGDKFPVKIVATNKTSQGIRIKAATSAPYYIYLLQYKDASWKRIKTYPSASAIVATQWVIPPHGTRTFVPVLTVEPDWPMYENLRLVVSLNGREDVAPFFNIEILKAK